MIIGPDIIHPSEEKEGVYIFYYAKNAALDDVRSWTAWPINNHLRKLRLADAGIEDSQVSDLFDWVDVGGMGLVSVDESTGDISDAQEATQLKPLLYQLFL